MKLLDLAVKREQEVALRAHIEKIIHFARVLALLKQRKRLRVKVNDHEYVIAEPEDFVKAIDILHTSIIETVSRVEKRHEEVLKLFDACMPTNIHLQKHVLPQKNFHDSA